MLNACMRIVIMNAKRDSTTVTWVASLNGKTVPLFLNVFQICKFIEYFGTDFIKLHTLYIKGIILRPCD